MENRFGFKELILSVLMVAIIVVLLLAMKQYDRQWEQLRAIGGTLERQNQQLKALNQTLSSGVKLSNGNSSMGGHSNVGDAFPRIVAAMKTPDYASGDWNIDAVGAAIGKLTPLTSSDVYASMVGNYVHQSLAVRDADTLEWRPLIAKSWQISDDGLTITFDMREDVTFSDGKLLTAHDVQFTYEWIMNPNVAAPRSRAYISRISSVTAENDYRVTFKLSEPYFKGFELCAGLEVLAKHWYGQFTEDEFNAEPGLLFGSGPYRLPMDPIDWKPGSGKVELVRNEQYWGVPPAFDRVVFREITDETARLVAFRNGEIDTFGPRPEQYVSLKNDADLLKDKDLYEYESVAGGYRYIAWNQMRGGEPSLFADKRVRQAMTLLTDRELMCKKLQVGLATPNSGPFHRLGNQANPQIKPWPYDTARAKQLLKEAGFEDRNDDGVIEDENGRLFQFKLIYPSNIINYQQMAFTLKDAYARAGIALEPDPLEWTIMLQRIGQRDYDAMTLGWSSGIENDPYQIFHSAQVQEGGDNYVHYINEELDRLIEQARRTMDESERMKMWHQVHRILHEDQPYTFLWTSRAVIFVDKRMHNVQQLKLGLNSKDEWFVPLPLQKWSN